MTLTLPVPFAECRPGPYFEYGKRTVCWSLKAPGVLHRNQFSMAWFDITERQPFKGEPLWLTATRRPPDANHARVPFTDPARDALSRTLLPVVARYGFDRWWTELHQAKTTAMADSNERGRAHALQVVAWYDVQAELVAMHAEGLLELRPLTTEQASRGHGNGYTVDIPQSRGTTTCSQRAGGSLWLNGEQVGWLGTDGTLLPPQGLLR